MKKKTMGAVDRGFSMVMLTGCYQKIPAQSVPKNATSQTSAKTDEKADNNKQLYQSVFRLPKILPLQRFRYHFQIE